MLIYIFNVILRRAVAVKISCYSRKVAECFSKQVKHSEILTPAHFSFGAQNDNIENIFF